MNLDCKHISVRVADIEATKDFYINKLGLTLLDEKHGFLAAKTGMIRISFFGGFAIADNEGEKHVGNTIAFSTSNIEDTRDELINKGVQLTTDITNANNYLKFISLKDPNGLVVSIAEYLIKDLLENRL